MLERNDDYWGPKAKNEGLIMRYYSKSSTMKLGLERGEIDMAYQTFTPTELGSLAENKNVKVYQGQGAAIRYLVMNVQRPPFNNVAVRRAMAYLMPRQSIASRVYRGTVKPLYSMPPAGSTGPRRRVRVALRPRAERGEGEGGAEEGRHRDADADRGLVDADALR